jgi:hypothetical protein
MPERIVRWHRRVNQNHAFNLCRLFESRNQRQQLAHTEWNLLMPINRCDQRLPLSLLKNDPPVGIPPVADFTVVGDVVAGTPTQPATINSLAFQPNPHS